MNFLVSGFLVCASVAAPVASATQNERADPSEALEVWRAEQGSTWQLVLRPDGRHAALIHGRSAMPETLARTDDEFAALAEDWLVRTLPLHGVAPETLEVKRVVFLPLGQAGTTDKIAVELHQVLDGVPVVRGFVHVLMDLQGRLLSVDSQALCEVRALDARPRLTADGALELARERFRADSGRIETFVSDARLVAERDELAGLERPRLAWEIDVENDDETQGMAGFTYRLDAHTGELVRRIDRVLAYDVTGTVVSLVSPRVWPDVLPAPETIAPMANLEVTSAAGTVYTSTDGTFRFQGVGATPAAPLTVTVRYRGPYALSNQGGTSYALTVDLTAPSQNRIVMNRDASEEGTAQANAFYWLNRVREWTRAVDPMDTVLDFQVLAQVNVGYPPHCGGSFNTSEIRFRRSRSACEPWASVPLVEFSCVTPGTNASDGCTNKANATIIVHEMGHWMNLLYSGVGGLSEFNEGVADAWAYFITDQPYLDPRHCSIARCLRSGETLLQFCGDANTNCHGNAHDGGKVIAGALWKVRANLKVALGDALGRLTADTLFHSWMFGYSDNAITSIIQTHWLLLDDDDGILTNGTPNFTAIRAGFATQGFPPPF